MLLVVVDQARVRRRRDDGVERAAEVQVPRVAVVDGRVARGRGRRERLDPLERVEL